MRSRCRWRPDRHRTSDVGADAGRRGMMMKDRFGLQKALARVKQTAVKLADLDKVAKAADDVEGLMRTWRPRSAWIWPRR
ncbi:hypothetical protein AB5I41_09245 [Sphingomonas sp. MMS24-JH45]